MARTAEELQAALYAIMPPSYRTEVERVGIAAGLPGSLALVETFIDEAQAQTVASTATGMWLRTYAQGRGVQYLPTDDDATVRAKIKSWSRRGTAQAVEDAVNAILESAGSLVPCVVIEGWQSRLYLVDETDPADYTTDCYCDEDNWIGDFRWLVVLCPDGLGDDVETAIASIIRWAIVCGIEAYAQFADGYDPVYSPLQPWPV